MVVLCMFYGQAMNSIDSPSTRHELYQYYFCLPYVTPSDPQTGLKIIGHIELHGCSPKKAADVTDTKTATQMPTIQPKITAQYLQANLKLN